MPVIVGTNSYVTIAEADTYLADSARAGAWAFLGTAQKTSALITAARMMETVTWQGTKTNSSQALAWPRAGVIDRYGNAVDSVAVPNDIKNGQIELAFDLSQDPTIATKENSGSNVASVGAGSANVSFFRPVAGSRFPFASWAILGPYASGGAAAASFGLPVVGGSDDPEESTFAGGSPYTVEEGLS